MPDSQPASPGVCTLLMEDPFSTTLAIHSNEQLRKDRCKGKGRRSRPPVAAEPTVDLVLTKTLSDITYSHDGRSSGEAGPSYEDFCEIAQDQLDPNNVDYFVPSGAYNNYEDRYEDDSDDEYDYDLSIATIRLVGLSDDYHASPQSRPRVHKPKSGGRPQAWNYGESAQPRKIFRRNLHLAQLKNEGKGKRGKKKKKGKNPAPAPTQPSHPYDYRAPLPSRRSIEQQENEQLQAAIAASRVTAYASSAVRQPTFVPHQLNISREARPLVATTAQAVVGVDARLARLLIELQSREITPEDYDLLLALSDQTAVKKRAAPSDKVDSLTREQLSDSHPLVLDSTIVCTVCLGPYLSDEQATTLPCQHVFHANCIKKWLRDSSPNCPLDGTAVFPED